jgi:hypothetical protein
VQQVEFGTHYAPHAGGKVRIGPGKVGIQHAGEQVHLHHTVYLHPATLVLFED